VFSGFYTVHSIAIPCIVFVHNAMRWQKQQVQLSPRDHAVHYVSWNLVNCYMNNANRLRVSPRSTFCNATFYSAIYIQYVVSDVYCDKKLHHYITGMQCPMSHTLTAHLMAHSHCHDWTEVNWTKLVLNTSRITSCQFTSVPAMRMGLQWAVSVVNLSMKLRRTNVVDNIAISPH